jgi:CO dehydrogenase maturation factor
VIDNEAGMEHISRRTNGNLDVLLLISDPSLRGVRTCKKLEDLVNKLGLNIKKLYLMINRVDNGVPPQVTEELEKLKLNLVGILPEDKNIIDCELRGIPMLNLEDNSLSVIKLNEVMANNLRI